MGKSFLIVEELKEMLNKLQLFQNSSSTQYERELYTDAKSAIRTLVAIESEG